MNQKREEKERLPSWTFFTIIIAGIIAVMISGYYAQHMQIGATTAATKIGKYYDRTMTENIDQKASVGILGTGVVEEID